MNVVTLKNYLTFSISAIFYIKKSHILYLLKIPLQASAICFYSIEEINNAFNSDVRKDDPKPTFMKNDIPECDAMYFESMNETTKTYLHIKSKIYPLRKTVLFAKTIFQEPAIHFKRITFHESIKQMKRINLFIYSRQFVNNNYVIIQLKVKPTVCIERKLLMNENVTMIQVAEEKSKPILFVGTETRLLKFPLGNQCPRYTSEYTCTSDSYCGWSKVERLCQYYNYNDPLNVMDVYNVVPPSDTCSLILNKTWEDKNKFWNKCKLYSTGNILKSIGSCQCRKLLGVNVIEVSKNCQVNGDLTPWSAWAHCSVTCGESTQSRSRSCSFPNPTNGGEQCKGFVIENRSCKALKKCKESEIQVSLNYAPWSPWSPTCSRTCGISYQTRVRRCKTEPYCTLFINQKRHCPTNVCTEYIEFSWSEWFMSSNVRRRYKFQCTKYFMSLEPVRIQLQALKTRIKPTCKGVTCIRNYSNQILTDNLTNWTVWSNCTVKCGTGYRKRIRSCKNSGLCLGPLVELELCNIHPCTSTWSCWMNWTPCIRQCETSTITQRHRKCNIVNNNQCVGSLIEEKPCPLNECTKHYSTWTTWGMCNSNGERKRERRCLVSLPCIFPLIQIKSCSGALLNIPVKYSSIYMVASGLLGLLVGVIVGLTICYIWYRCTITVIKKSESLKFSEQTHNNRQEEYLDPQDMYSSQLLTKSQISGGRQRSHSGTNEVPSCSSTFSVPVSYNHPSGQYFTKPNPQVHHPYPKIHNADEYLYSSSQNQYSPEPRSSIAMDLNQSTFVEKSPSFDYLVHPH